MKPNRFTSPPIGRPGAGFGNPPEPSSSGRERWPFTARAEELDAFTAALDDQATTAVIVHGQAGVGKSRLADECLRLAARRGHRVEKAVATPSLAALPLGALAHLLPADAVSHDPVAAFHAAARAFGLRPEPKHRPDAPDRPAVLFIDDLHLLDNASAVLLGHLLWARAVFLIATVRDGAPPSDAVEAIDRSESTRRIAVRPFSRAQVRNVLRRCLGHPIEHAALDALVASSQGNALFLYELVSGAVDDGTLELGDGLWRLNGRPTGTRRLSAIIRQRLQGLSGPREELFELVALCEPIPLSALRPAGSGAGDVEWLEKQGLIQVHANGRRTYCTLGHPLYGEVVRRHISPRRRREVYTAQVRRLRSHGVRRREDALCLASWQLAAELPVDTELLVSAAAMARHVRDFPTVLELLSRHPDSQAPFAVWLMRGEAYHHTGNWERAEQCLSRAQQSAGGEAELLTAVMERTQNLFWGFGDTRRTLEVNAAAEAGLGASGRRILRINEAGYLMYCGDIRTVLHLLEDAEKVHVPRLRMWGQLQMSLALSYVGRTREAAELSRRVHEELTGAAAEEGRYDPSSHCSGPAIYRVVALTEAGRPDEARTIGEDAFTRAVGAQAVYVQAWIAAHMGRCELMAGRLEQARDWYAEAISLARANDYPRPLVLSCAGLAAVQAQLGAVAEARSALEGARSAPDLQQASNLSVQLAAAWIEAADGHLPEARALLTAAAHRAGEVGMHSYEGWLLSDAARLGGAAQAQDRLGELARTSDSDLARARAISARAHATGSADALHTAADQCLLVGAELLAAETACEASRAAEREGDQRGAAAAAVLAGRSLARCGGALTPALGVGTARPLTRRESEIAELAAEGLTSQEIAGRLVLSIRTVDNHLQRVYSKLGIASRTQLADALAGLAEIRTPAARRKGNDAYS
ncbi:ATP-, maltotriose-and DNA-dependent transcriptional regulator MalT [Streptomyces sp. Ag82_O1-12]|uniref:LuxR C-terminal-related transcriptional regulator n=1 Tax=unclassified Streptomyces TaxID=2593676 RepID=UPI000BC8D505|nr:MULTISPECIES: LuxR family transcriptional regulator [unclassified Streptomyces]SMQ14590.1 ATP-, maltotriose-and DNA-dependent transcriptional regulator MalT [Streptomyces sp. Ag82_O1-12]SOD43617.1 ATP-, maltotriose- and DNA-dependent transcriptional regulator MalT [Streptomyces sp. Ag82_G6-1]